MLTSTPPNRFSSSDVESGPAGITSPDFLFFAAFVEDGVEMSSRVFRPAVLAVLILETLKKAVELDATDTTEHAADVKEYLKSLKMNVAARRAAG